MHACTHAYMYKRPPFSPPFPDIAPGAPKHDSDITPGTTQHGSLEVVAENGTEKTDTVPLRCPIAALPRPSLVLGLPPPLSPNSTPGARPNMTRSEVVADNGTEEIDPIRTSYGTFLETAQDDVIKRIEDRIATWTFLAPENQESMQVLRYAVGQKYDAHHDFFEEDEKQQQGGHRYATVLMYLTDGFHGGETVFPDSEKDKQEKDDTWSDCGKQGVAAKPVKGDALLFFSLKPSAEPDLASLHAGCPVLAGEKWSATKWIHVRSFEEEEDGGEEGGKVSSHSHPPGACVDESEHCPFPHSRRPIARPRYRVSAVAAAAAIEVARVIRNDCSPFPLRASPFPLPASPIPLPAAPFPLPAPHYPFAPPHFPFPLPITPSRLPNSPSRHPISSSRSPLPLPASPFPLPAPHYPFPPPRYPFPPPRYPFPPPRFPFPPPQFPFPPPHFLFPLPITPSRLPITPSRLPVSLSRLPILSSYQPISLTLSALSSLLPSYHLPCFLYHVLNPAIQWRVLEAIATPLLQVLLRPSARSLCEQRPALGGILPISSSLPALRYLRVLLPPPRAGSSSRPATLSLPFPLPAYAPPIPAYAPPIPAYASPFPTYASLFLAFTSPLHALATISPASPTCLQNPSFPCHNFSSTPIPFKPLPSHPLPVPPIPFQTLPFPFQSLPSHFKPFHSPSSPSHPIPLPPSHPLPAPPILCR
ncbi:unnamed protein product [Closterium sp. NIES-65]|nr:unnamed protein product [Closterium sp. NIES-65]